ncbi:MAG TPA: hypothetical protein EYQ06_02385 [Flavobacteriales bacterium]|nr:hypothetical protein [Flavobacteriales bacterium]HIL26611.1 hypothetical protein [Nitrospinaceae bacterium]
MNKKIIFTAFAVSMINTNVIAGFFDNLVNNLQNGDLGSLVTDVVTDVGNEIDKAQDDSDIKSNTESNDVLNNLGTLFNNSNAPDNSDSYSEDEAEHNIDSEEKNANIFVVSYDQLTSPGASFFGESDFRKYYKNKLFTGIADNKADDRIHDDSKIGFYRVRTTFKDGVKNGLQEAWHKNGNKKNEGNAVPRPPSKRGYFAEFDYVGEYKKWHKNGVMASYDWVGEKPKVGFVSKRWSSDGNLTKKAVEHADNTWSVYFNKVGFKIKEFVRYYPDVNLPDKVTFWNDAGIKIFEGLDTGNQSFLSSRQKYHGEFPEGYAVHRDEDGVIKSLHTTNTISLSNSKCSYDYYMAEKPSKLEIKTGSVHTSIDNYSITSHDFINKCIPIAYKVCKEANGVDKCDKLFYQGKYSQEYLNKETYRSRLVKIDEGKIEDILISNRYKKSKFKAKAKLSRDIDSDLEEKRLNYFKEMNVKKPNIYGADDVKVTKVNGKKVWKDLSGELVTGAILGPRYGKDLIFKNFFQVKNGLVNGLRWEFYSTGQPKTLKAMKDGVENGVFMRWDKYGFVITKAKLKNGKTDGKVRFYYDKDLLSRITNKKYEALTFQRPLLSNEYDIFGRWKYIVKKFYSQTLPLQQQEHHKDGAKTGLVTFYWPNEKKRVEYNEVDGKLSGNMTYYHPWDMDENTGEQKVSDHVLKLNQATYLTESGFLGGVEAFMSATGMTATINDGPEFGSKDLGKHQKYTSKSRNKIKPDSKLTLKSQAFITKPTTVRCQTQSSEGTDEFVAMKDKMVIENENDVQKAIEECQLVRNEYFDTRQKMLCFKGYEKLSEASIFDISRVRNKCKNTYNSKREKHSDSYLYDMTPLDKKYLECSENPNMICYDRLLNDFESVAKNYPDLSNWEVLDKEKIFLLK